MRPFALSLVHIQCNHNLAFMFGKKFDCSLEC